MVLTGFRSQLEPRDRDGSRFMSRTGCAAARSAPAGTEVTASAWPFTLDNRQAKRGGIPATDHTAARDIGHPALPFNQAKSVPRSSCEVLALMS